MRKLVAVAGLAAMPLVAMADTNLDNLVSQVTTGFGTAAVLAVTVTVFWWVRRQIKKSAGG